MRDRDGTAWEQALPRAFPAQRTSIGVIKGFHMSQFRRLAFASCLSAVMIASPVARAATIALPRPCAPIIMVVDRLANPVPSEDAGSGDDQADPGMDPRDDVNNDSGSDMMQPDEMPGDGAAPKPPAVSNDKGNSQDVLPQDDNDSND